MGDYRANPGVTDKQLMARYNDIMEKKRGREQKHDSAAKPENVKGYEIKRAITFSNDRGFALAENPRAPSPFVTWQFTTQENGMRDYFWGHYITKQSDALKDYENRVNEYMADNPSVTVVVNPLAAAEMSMEQNNNQIDGVVNNLPAETEQDNPGQRLSAVERLEAAKQAVKPPAPVKASARSGPEL